MARLAQSPRIHHWFGKYLLKGFSTAIVPSQKLNDAILWHLYYSDGERLPYPDMGTIQCADVDGNDMAKGRHILGWCSEAHFYAGSKDANYAIRESRLGLPGKDFSLEKVSFSVGQIVTGGCQFSIGRKDTPIRITRGGYVDKLRWIRQRYFTLYDIDDNRGFLIDGASTLLHLLRTSLHLSAVDEFASEFLFEHSKFQESTDPLKRSSALKVLLNEANRRLPLYREDANTSTTVQHRIEQLYETLEKLVDHASHVEAAHKGINSKPRISTHLKGWDFADLAADRDPFHLKVAKLPLSVPWVDFTRAIPAVTLFGRGFGELIRPAAHPHPYPQAQTQTQTITEVCLDWMALPTGQYHLCVGIADLRNIVRRTVGSDDAATPSSSSSSSNNNTVAPGMVLCYNENTNSTPLGGGREMFRKCVCEGLTGAAATAAAAVATRPVLSSATASLGCFHPVLELVSEGFGWGGMGSMGGPFNDTDGGGGGSKMIVDLSACPSDGAVILGMPKSKRLGPWPRMRLPSVSLQSLTLGVGPKSKRLWNWPQQSLASAASAGSSASSTELDSEAGSGSATPPTSVASGGSGAGDDADPVPVDGSLGSPVGAGTKRRRGWCSSEDGSEGSGFGSVETGKRRKMLSKMRDIRRSLVRGAPGRDGVVDGDMAEDVEMEEG
ncbi:hypothetical protein F5144DRAFT_594479 [Chaetomium tenue]|uniref:Uncharacterized protein n=1 Tax=Chaetomium tenue TaxID=1854479 RepID=A0ACB7P3Z9_9PEZI|nr:hypothetical protein F5144DRAFT_594479 [Chaetomium globosum]